MVDDQGPTNDLYPYGAGSHAPLDDAREMPGCYPIKGNVRDDGSRLYHRPDSRNYGATVPEVWFDSPSAAEAAGFELSPTHPRGSTGVEYEPGRSAHPCTVAQVMAIRNEAPGGAMGGAGVLAGAPATDEILHPYGVGSHAPLDDAREMPGCHPIKGNVRDDGSRLYHRPDSRNYGATVPEVWFDSPSAAEAAGFELSPTHPRGSTGVEYEPGRSDHPCTVADVDRIRAEAGGFAIQGLAAGTGAAAGWVLGGDVTDAELHPYGVGSHALIGGGQEMPGCYPIKGNIRGDGSRLYHRPDSRNYGATRAEVWFDSPSAAEAAGFVLAPTHPRRADASDFEPGGSAHPCTVGDVDGHRAVSAGLAVVGLGLLGAAAAGAMGAGDGDDTDAGEATVDADEAAAVVGDDAASVAATASDDDAVAGDGDGEGDSSIPGAAVAAGAVAGAVTLSRLQGDAGDEAEADASVAAPSQAAVDAADVDANGGTAVLGLAGRGEIDGGSDADGVDSAPADAEGPADAHAPADADADADVPGGDDEGGIGLGGVAAGAAAAGAAGLALAASAGDKAAGAAGKAGDAATGAAGKVGDAVSGVTGKARDKAAGSADKVSTAAGKAGGKAGAAVGGAGGKAGAAGGKAAGTTAAAAAGKAGGKAADAGKARGSALAGRFGAGGGGFGLGRWLWTALAVLALVLLLGWLLSRCGNDDETATVGAGDTSEQNDPGSPTTVDGSATTEATGDSTGDSAGGEDASSATTEDEGTTTTTEEEATTTTEEEEATTTTEASTTTVDPGIEIQAVALQALAAAGIEGVEVEVDGDTVRLVGEVGAEADLAAAETAVAGVDGVASVTNELTVVTETPPADPTEGDPDFTG